MVNAYYATGAYGRPASLKDWNNGKDFRSSPINSFYPDSYFSKKDTEVLKGWGYTEIRFLLPDSGNSKFNIGFKVEL